MRTECLFLLALLSCSIDRSASAEEGAVSDTGIQIFAATYEGRDHFVVESPSATYWVDKNSGGLSRLIDRGGNDWIGFRIKPWGEYPAAAASSFRGLPNAVHGGDDGGFGHPGWDEGATEQIDEDTLLTTSTNGKWQLRWDFTDDGAMVAIVKADRERKYWFLYEGPIAGRFKPDQQYFATNTRTPVTKPKDYIGGDRFFETWRWAYFGDRSVPRVLAIVHDQDDELIDTFAHLGNDRRLGLVSPDGMVVFGFGRGPDGIEPLLTGENSFRIRFIEQAGVTGEEYQQLNSQLSSASP